MAQAGHRRSCRATPRSIIEPGRTTLPSMLRKAGLRDGRRRQVASRPRSDRAVRTGTARSRPARNDVGFDYSFIMAATGDRVPTVYVENRRVVGLDPADPISVSYGNPIGDWPTGKAHPELLTMQPSHGHDQTIVNGISRIGYMTGGKAALWKDEDMADVFTRQARVVHRDAQGRAVLPVLRDARSARAARAASPVRRQDRRWDRAATPSLEADWSVGEMLNTLDRLEAHEQHARDLHERQRPGGRRRLQGRRGGEARQPPAGGTVSRRQVQQLRRRHARAVHRALAAAHVARGVSSALVSPGRSARVLRGADRPDARRRPTRRTAST